MIKINVILNNNGWKKYLKNPHRYIKKKIDLINNHNKSYKKNILICTLLLSGTKEIKKLNKRFRKKNKSTDILSFPFQEKKILFNKIKKQKEIYLGDIIINIDKIRNKDNFLFEEKFDKLWIHGLTHLFGYKHKKDKDYDIMIKIENRFNKFLN